VSAEKWILLIFVAALAIAAGYEQVQNHRRRRRIAELEAKHPTPEQP